MFAFLRVAGFTLLTAGITTVTGRARAIIVVDGKTVSAWPESELREPAPGTALDTVGTPGIKLFPHPSGVVHGLTILVDFSDQAGAYSKAEIDAWLNTKGYQRFGLTGSIRDYYLKQSNGAVDYQNEVHGFYRAKKAKSYYQGGDGYERADELWGEVIAALDAEIDFSQFDNDHDGKTEAISLLYAGDEGTFGKGLWPHASASNDQRDGVRLSRYMMTAMDDQPTNYVFAHESGHMLFGWPDLYGVGDYSIMANRGANTNPVGVDDVLRADQGWIALVDIQSTTNARYEATPNGVVYRYLNPARPTEYFLWSNVQNVGEWQSLAGGGLLVWHFDQAIHGNNPPQTLELAVVQGGGTRQLSATQWPSPGSAKTDFFVKGVNTELSATTKPASQWNNGSASGLRIYDIGPSGSTIAFSVGVGPIVPTGEGGGAGRGGAPGAGGAAAQGGSSSAGRSGVSVGGSSAGGSSGSAAAGSDAAGSDAAGSGAAGTTSNSSGAAGAAGAKAPNVGGSSNAAGAPSGAVGAAPSSGESGCACSITSRSSRSGAIALAFAAL
ncbi:MAG TPA: M6 family metalloprotease domain-containing protein, partial [Polyangiaceae bacterium]|nr:M6 family metalloprotease domain-containing protein [Polyangiaceae bacterium]